jgi:resuscitation-promoting factor RpfA
VTARSGQLLTALLSVLDGYALCRLAPAPGELLRNLAAPHAWVDRVGPDVAVSTAAGALLWLAALWLAVGLGATLITTITGRRRGLLIILSRRATPALVRRLVIASTGASIALTPLTASAAPGVAPNAPSGSIAVTWPTDPVPEPASPSWPLDQAGVGSSRSQPPPAATDRPGLMPGGQPAAPWTASGAGTITTTPPSRTFTITDAGAPPTATETIPATAKPAPPVIGRTPGPPLDPAPDPDRPASSSVLVKPGDSLWLITAQRLGPTATDDQIAVEWPYWYRKNRPVIGRDPNLLRPGQRLAVPAPEGKA